MIVVLPISRTRGCYGTTAAAAAACLVHNYCRLWPSIVSVTDRMADVANTCPLEPIDKTAIDAITTTRSAVQEQQFMLPCGTWTLTRLHRSRANFSVVQSRDFRFCFTDKEA